MAAPSSIGSEIVLTQPQCETASNFISSGSNKFQICICLLCGLPGSGKSTLLQSLIYYKNHEKAETCLQNSNTVMIGIEYDTILPDPPPSAHHAKTDNSSVPEDGVSWKSDRLQVLSALEAILQHIKGNSGKDVMLMPCPENIKSHIWCQFSAIQEAIAKSWTDETQQVLFIIDDNMFFQSMRYEYYKLARRYNAGFCQVYVDCSVESAIDRNCKRDKESQVPNDVIYRMSAKFQPPDPDRNQWEKHSIVINSEKDANLEEIVSLINHSFMTPVPPLEEKDEAEKSRSRIECSASLLHQADLILRKCVALIMEQMKSKKEPQQLKGWSKHISKVKEKFLQDLREGHVQLMLRENSVIQNAAQDSECEFYQVIGDLFLLQCGLESQHGTDCSAVLLSKDSDCL